MLRSSRRAQRSSRQSAPRQNASRRNGPARLALALASVLSVSLWDLPAAAAIHGPEQAKLVLAADRTAYDPGTTAHLAALVTIVPGWHVNAHKPTFDYLIPTEVVLTLPAGWPAAAVRYP
jgi:thiol:disulfide interchange protein DsbD